MVEASLVTKRYLVRVCKEWNALATPLLYRIIVVRKGCVLQSLAETLEASRMNVSGLGVDSCDRPLGWYTTRCDVLIKENTIPAALRERYIWVIGYLERIIWCLPNLAICMLNPKIKWLDDLLHTTLTQTLINSCGSTLRLTNHHPPSEDLYRFLGATPNLQSFHRDISPPPDSPFIDMPPVSKLSLGPYSHLEPLHERQQIVPSLRYLELECGITDNLVKFLHLHSNRLNVISLILHRPIPEAPLNIDFIQDSIPELTRLVLVLRFSRGLEDLAVSTMTNVAMLGLRLEYYVHTKHDYDMLFTFLRSIHAPKLRVIRFLEEHTVSRLRMLHRRCIREAMTFLTSQGVSVQDHEGRPLFGPTINSDSSA